MSIVIIDVAAITPQPWRNGGGQTRELIAWPLGDRWKLRISRADIESDGPFILVGWGVYRWLELHTP